MLHPGLVSIVRSNVQSKLRASYNTLTCSKPQTFALSGAHRLDLGMQVSSAQTAAVRGRTCVYTWLHLSQSTQASSLAFVRHACSHLRTHALRLERQQGVTAHAMQSESAVSLDSWGAHLLWR